MSSKEFQCSRFTLSEEDQDSEKQPIKKDFKLISRWEKRELTWRVTKFPTRTLTEKQVLDTITEALEIWAKYCPMKFTFLEAGHVDMEMM